MEPSRTFKCRVLIVEDDKLVLETTAAIVRSFGFSVRTAEDGFIATWLNISAAGLLMTPQIVSQARSSEESVRSTIGLSVVGTQQHRRTFPGGRFRALSGRD